MVKSLLFSSEKMFSQVRLFSFIEDIIFHAVVLIALFCFWMCLFNTLFYLLVI